MGVKPQLSPSPAQLHRPRRMEFNDLQASTLCALSLSLLVGLAAWGHQAAPGAGTHLLPVEHPAARRHSGGRGAGSGSVIKTLMKTQLLFQGSGELLCLSSDRLLLPA